MEEKKLEILYDHYKDTFENIKSYLERRNLYTLTSIVLVGFLSIELTVPNTTVEVSNALIKEKVGDIKIDRERYLITFKGTEMAVPRKEFELLYLLASKPGKVFKRDEILNEIWGRDIIVGDRTIDVHIRKLREKLGEDLIKTVKGIGYKFDEI